MALVPVVQGFSVGMKAALASGMIATTHAELFAWRLSARLRDEVIALTEHGPVAHDFRFRGQIRDSAASAPSNLSEGFYRFNPKEFSYFARVARGSLGETKNHLSDGLTRRYFSEEEFLRLFNLASWAMATTTNLLTYLLSCVAQGKAWRPGSVELPDLRDREPDSEPGTLEL